MYCTVSKDVMCIIAVMLHINILAAETQRSIPFWEGDEPWTNGNWVGTTYLCVGEPNIVEWWTKIHRVVNFCLPQFLTGHIASVLSWHNSYISYLHCQIMIMGRNTYSSIAPASIHGSMQALFMQKLFDSVSTMNFLLASKDAWKAVSAFSAVETKELCHAKRQLRSSFHNRSNSFL